MKKNSALHIHHWHTQHGVPVYYVHTPSLPMIDLRVVFRAGSCRDGEKPGIADLTNGLLDEGSAQLSADEIARRLDGCGAIYRANIRQDSASICLRSLTGAQYFKPALETFQQILSQPAFGAESFERVQKQLITGLEAELQQPSTVARHAFYEALYGEHPYGHPMSGTIDSVKKLTRQDVSHFYQQFYCAQNALVALVGDINLSQAEQIAEQLTHSLPQGKAAPTTAMADLKAPINKSIVFPSQQSTIVLGQVGITPQEPDYFPLVVGNYTLGSGGFVSRLYQQVREQRGLVYGIHSSFAALAARGPFTISLQTRNEEAANAEELTREILRKFIQEGVTDSELAAAQKNLLGSFPLDLASNSDIMAQIVRLGFYQLPLDYLDTYRDNVASVTTEKVLTAFQKHVQPDALTKVVVGEKV
jgi:zinc protease